MNKQVLVSMYLWMLTFAADEESKQHMPNSSTLLACSSGGDSCSTGLFCKDGRCKCTAHPDHIMYCNGTDIFLLGGYCGTYDEEKQLLSVGLCLHVHLPYSSNHHPQYHHGLQRNAYSLNNHTCQSLNRTGTLCGRCLPDQYPLAYSYYTKCIHCPHAHRNWVRYITAAYLPLTLFYLVIIFFKINTTSSHLFAVVYFCQSLSNPALLRGTFIGRYNKSKYFIVIQLYSTIYSIWNLDFFRPFYSDFCLGIGILPTLALDYAIAVYPLLLITISYLFITMYDRNYRVITILWRPFQVLFSLSRRNWNIRASVLHAFSTFFFLSNVKFLSTSVDLLVPVRVYHLYGDTYNYTVGLYYAADIEYFGREHLPYGILAVVTLCIFVILPVAILAFYPFKFFQKFLNLFPFRWYILHTFMDCFQGSYKNGTELNTRDYRWFASTFFISRLLLAALYFSTINDLFSSLAAVMLLFHSSMLAIFQPFKFSHHHYNTVHLTFMQILALFAVLQNGHTFAFVYNPSFLTFIDLLIVTCVSIPVLYALAWTLYWLYTHRRFIIDRFRARKTGYTPLPEQILPDRIENSGEYPRENLANLAGSK